MGKRREPSPLAGGWGETARLRGPALAAVASVIVAILVYALGVEAWRIVTFGGTLPFYLLALPIAFHWLGPRRGVGLIASLAVTVAATDALKDLLDLPRPPRELWLVEAEGPGFPSGHASSSASFWGYLALARPTPYTFIASILVPGLVGASRIALNVHYPHDVAGGLLLGYTMAALAWALQARLSPYTLLAAATLAAGALEALSFARLEVVAAPLGSLAGIAAYKKLAGEEPLGVKAGVMGSLAALALGAPAAALEDEIVDLLSTATAAFGAIAIPPLALTRARTYRRRES